MLADTESCSAAGRHRLVDLKVADSGARRPVPDLPLETFDRFRLAFDRHFHATVRKVLHPSVESFARGLGLGEQPKADALHTTADYISSRDTHSRGFRAASLSL